MVSEENEKLENKLFALQVQYVEGIAGRLQEIEDGWAEMARRIDDGRREYTIRKVHGLAGSGGIYGFSAITEAAKIFERKLVEIRESGSLPSCEQVEEGQTRLDNLCQAVQDCIREVQAQD